MQSLMSVQPVIFAQMQRDDAEKIVMDEAVIYPLYTQCNAEMLSSKVTGVEYHPVAINRVYKDAVKTE